MIYDGDVQSDKEKIWASSRFRVGLISEGKSTTIVMEYKKKTSVAYAINAYCSWVLNQPGVSYMLLYVTLL